MQLSVGKATLLRVPDPVDRISVGNPAIADYHDPMYDPFYEEAVALCFPLSFHILTSSEDSLKTRGPKLNAFMRIIRGCQDIIGTFIFGGVFERHPKLKLVCSEFEISWIPNFMWRIDQMQDDFGHRLSLPKLKLKASEYMKQRIWHGIIDDPFGVEATRRITATHPSSRVVILTASDDHYRIQDALRAGAASYVLKHCDPDQVVRAVQDARPKPT